MPLKRKRILQILQQTVELRTPELDLSNCQVGDFLEEICQMDWLTELNLSRCYMRYLPEAIGKLTALTRLDLSENQLSALPESITQLTALAYLNVDRVGYEFTVSASVLEWARRIPVVSWTNGEPPIIDELKKCFLTPDHPNQWLTWLKQALHYYNDAFNMEERGGNGYPTRSKADAEIQQIFGQRVELELLLPAFYADFKEHRFYWSNCESEKTLDNNPFRLPTEADEAWLMKHALADLVPIQLTDKILDPTRIILSFNTQTGHQSEIIRSEYGVILVSNQPYAEDEIYEANCEATLYQAGRERLYVQATVFGQGNTSRISWIGSDDRGYSWQKQAYMTYDWLTMNCCRWPELSHLPQLG